MSKDNSSSPPASGKPAKPYHDFPLYAHATGRWAKKIRGRLVYFGQWDDPDGALQRYLDQKDDLHAGRSPADAPEALTVYSLCGKFLTTKKTLLDTGELSIHSWNDYAATCKRLIKVFGRGRLVADLNAGDFERLRSKIALRWGLVRLGNEVSRIRSIFKYGTAQGLILTPVVFGQSFVRPSRRSMRKHRAAQGPRMFEAAETARMLAAAGQPLKAMILLGVNCGFGNSDVGTLPLSALNLDGAWINYPRPKTGIARRCPLWPETVASLREWLAMRPAPKDDAHAGLVFITVFGGTWAKTASDSPLSKEMAKLLRQLKIDGHRNFYALRHTFQTVGDEARDFIATRKIMGHAMDEDIATTYREKLSDERLRAVADHVRGWLWPKPLPEKKPAKAAKAAGTREPRAKKRPATSQLRIYA